MRQTVNQKEIEHFAADSGQWWDESGPFAPLHKLNPVRIMHLRDTITTHYDLAVSTDKPLKSLRILDVGCGGGLVCEPLSRLGANVTGIDADKNAIDIAQNHAKASGLKIAYKCSTTTELITQKSHAEKYDVVTALEIIEHVDNPDLFVAECFKLCKPGGIVIFSTLNRTPKSFGLGIIAAEYILNWVPKGTHNWKKFVKPAELSQHIRAAHGTPKALKGLIYNVREDKFFLSDTDFDVNYFLTAEK